MSARTKYVFPCRSEQIVKLTISQNIKRKNEIIIKTVLLVVKFTVGTLR